MTLTPEDCKIVRHRTGLSQARFGRLLGVGGTAIKRYEMSRDIESHRVPSGGVAVLYRLLLAGGISASDLETLADHGE